MKLEKEQHEPLEEIIEYTNAKLEAEIMITKLTNQLRDKVLIERYPRLLTDQTNTILNINTIDSSKLVVKTIRNLIKLWKKKKYFKKN